MVLEMKLYVHSARTEEHLLPLMTSWEMLGHSKCDKETQPPQNSGVRPGHHAAHSMLLPPSELQPERGPPSSVLSGTDIQKATQLPLKTLFVWLECSCLTIVLSVWGKMK